MAAPKKKTSRVRTSRRHAAFRSRIQKIITNKTRVVPCTHCGEKKISHIVCTACGYYAGREVIDMHAGHDHVTKVSA